VSGWLTTYRGRVEPSECDYWGHQNVQFYFTKAADAQAALCSALGLTPSWLRDRGAMMMPVRDRVLFKKELRAGDAASIRSGVRDARGTDVGYFSVLNNEGTDTKSALFETEARLVDIATAVPIALPSTVPLQAAHLAAQGPGHPQPAPIDGPRAPAVTPQHAMLTHRGTLDPFECDTSVWVTPRFQIARFGQASSQLIARLGLPKHVARGRNLGSAVLDYAIEYRTPLRTGQTIDIRSGVLETRPKVFRCFHHLIDTEQNRIATVIEIALLFFDLSARKSVAMPPELEAGARDALASVSIEA
jgi:acyl-CoA thioester hydrolase